MTGAGVSSSRGWRVGALLVGIALTFVSSFGQNFFVAVFGGEIRAAFGLSNGEFGLLYGGVTLASAAALVGVGRLADRISVSMAAALTLGAIGGAALLTGFSGHVAVFAIGLFLLRLFGQGMAPQLSETAVSRWFGKGRRGRALGVTSLGNPIGEATLPLLAVAGIALIGWRNVWLSGAALVLLVLLPTVLLLARRTERGHVSATVETSADGSEGNRGWVVSQVLRDSTIYLLVPGLLAPVTVNIAVFFHQVAIMDAKGWEPIWFVAGYPVSAVAIMLGTLVSGWLIDRIGPLRVLSYALLPMLAALPLLALGTSPLVVPIYLGLAGFGMGLVIPLKTAVLAEIYGTAHLGAIRAVVAACNIVLGALAPGISGIASDLGVDFSTQLVAMALYVAGTGVLLLVGLRVVDNRRLNKGSIGLH